MSRDRIIATPADGISLLTVDLEQVEALEREVLDEHGRQIPAWAGTYAKYSQATRGAFCVRNGIYGLVTHELVQFITAHIGERTAIEIGSGDGVLAQALGIPATDNYMQEWPAIRAEYERMQQAVIKYGTNVERLDGTDALAKYAPRVIVACWLTHKRIDSEPERGGNAFASDERMLLANCETVIFVGNSSTHAQHRLLGRSHRHFHEDWLYSRAVRGKNFVGIWKGGKA